MALKDKYFIEKISRYTAKKLLDEYHYLMGVQADEITVEDALEELGYGRNGLGS